jgi:transcriptional regulator with XRE-family HTH domain
MAKELIGAVASTIRHFRKACDMSQEDLADKAGLDRTYISGVERGVRNITLDSLELIIHALGVNIKSFFTKVSKEIDASNSK